MFKAVIFDFDGTLADTTPIALEAFRKALRPVHGRDLTDQEIRSCFGPTEEGVMTRLAPNCEQEALARYYGFYSELHSQLKEPFQGIRAVLLQLRERGVKLGIVTGKGEKSLMISLSRVGLDGMFDLLEAGCRDQACKPVGIRKMLAEWRIEPQDALYVGDAPSDVRSAREVGVPAASVAWADPETAPKLRAENPDYLFATVDDFKNMLLGPD